MIYVGIDPSYTKTGVSYVDLENREIYFNAISPEGTNANYNAMVQRALHIVDTILNVPQKFKDRAKTIIIEEPLMASKTMSSSLGILSGVVGSKLFKNCEEDNTRMFSLNPSTVSNTNRKLKGYTSRTRKKVSRDIARKYRDVFVKHGFNYVIHNENLNKDGTMKKRVLSHDEAESFIMLIILLRHLGKLPEGIEEDIIKVNRGLVTTDYTVNELRELDE